MKVTVSPAQITDALEERVTVGVTGLLTVIVISLEVAVLVVTQLSLEVITTLTISLLESEVELKVEALVPALLPFTFHWYEGDDPPFVGVAVKVTLLPEHMLVLLAEMETEGVSGVVTNMVIPPEVTVPLVTQLSLEVNFTVTTSLLARLLELKVEALVPA